MTPALNAGARAWCHRWVPMQALRADAGGCAVNGLKMRRPASLRRPSPAP
jgi:hypothetical protein